MFLPATTSTFSTPGRAWGLLPSMLAAAFTALSVLSLSCGGGEVASVQTSTAPMGISVSRTALSVSVGQTAPLTASVRPTAASQDVRWRSSNAAVARVTDKGLIEGVSVGSANVTATRQDGTFSATCAVSVTAGVEGVSLDRTGVTIGLGESVTLSASVRPASLQGAQIDWSSSNQSVAAVDQSGRVTGACEGADRPRHRPVGGVHPQRGRIPPRPP